MLGVGLQAYCKRHRSEGAVRNLTYLNLNACHVNSNSLSYFFVLSTLPHCRLVCVTHVSHNDALQKNAKRKLREIDVSVSADLTWWEVGYVS